MIEIKEQFVDLPADRAEQLLERLVIMGGASCDSNRAYLLQQLRLDDLRDWAAQRGYEALLETAQKGLEVDGIFALMPILRRTEQGQDVWREFIGLEAEGSFLLSAEWTAAIQSLQDTSARRRLERAGKRIQFLASGAEARPIADLIQESSRLLAEAAVGVRQRRVTGWKDGMQQLAHRLETGKALEGLQHFGIEPLDHFVTGVAPEEIAVVAGRPGMGKTAVLQHVARHLAGQAKKDGGAILWWSGEMSEDKMFARFAAMEEQMSLYELNRGAGKAWALFRSEALAAKDLPLFITTEIIRSAAELSSLVYEFTLRRELRCVIVDYLGLLTDNPADYEAITKISLGLKVLAREHKIPVLVAQQLSRDVEKRPDRRPQLSDLRQSGQIEQDASVVVFPFRPAYYDKEGEEQHDPLEMELIIAKNRDGRRGSVQVKWDPETFRFGDPTPRFTPQQEEIPI